MAAFGPFSREVAESLSWLTMSFGPIAAFPLLVGGSCCQATLHLVHFQARPPAHLLHSPECSLLFASHSGHYVASGNAASFSGESLQSIKASGVVLHAYLQWLACEIQPDSGARSVLLRKLNFAQEAYWLIAHSGLRADVYERLSQQAALFQPCPGSAGTTKQVSSTSV